MSPTELTVTPALGERRRGLPVKIGGFTLHELVKTTGLSKSYLSLLFRGLRPNPTTDVLTRLANALGVGLDDLTELLSRLQREAQTRHAVK